MKTVLLRAALALALHASVHAEDDVPFPLGGLGGKAFQTEGSSLLRVTEVTAGGHHAWITRGRTCHGQAQPQRRVAA